MTNSTSSPQGWGRALLLWGLFVLIFVVFGGIGAGVTSLIYEHVLGLAFTDTLYAIVFGATGFIAYRLAVRQF